MKTIGIHKNEQGTCDFIVEIVNVDKAQYEQLVKEFIHSKELEKAKENAILEALGEFKEEISNLKHEIAILKGEE